MRTTLWLLISLLLAAAHPALAQSNQFRDTRAHLGVGVGVFTYYGPINLKERESASNSITDSDLAVVLLGSFPIVRDRFFFRGMIGFTNFDTSAERDLLAQRSRPGNPAQNEFLAHELFFFEPQVIYTPLPGSRSRFLPYVYTGFGGLLADPISDTGRDNINRPGTGVPGPERSVFTFPIGVGVDFAVSKRFSFFFDASYRFNFNYVARNEINGVNPHNTSLVMGGIRIGLYNPFRERPVAVDRTLPLPEPLEIPPYQPPARTPIARQCILVELNSVYFAYNSIELDREARALLDANIEALRLNPECCLDVVGFTDRTDSATLALRLSRQRAEAVYQYYLARGVAQERMRVRAEGEAFPPCGKDEEGPGCRRNRRVDSIPRDCATFLRSLN